MVFACIIAAAGTYYLFFIHLPIAPVKIQGKVLNQRQLVGATLAGAPRAWRARRTRETSRASRMRPAASRSVIRPHYHGGRNIRADRQRVGSRR